MDYLRLLATYYWNPRRAASETLDRARLGVVIPIALVTALVMFAPAKIAERRAVFEMERLSASLVPVDRETPPTPETRAAYERIAKLSRQFEEPEEAWGFTSKNALAELALVLGLFVPAAIALLVAWEGKGRCSVAIGREYGSVALCVAMSWTAARLPLVPLQFAGLMPPWLPLASTLVFLGMAAVSLRTALGAQWGSAGVTSALGGGLMFAGGMLSVSLGSMVYLLASPCLLYYLWGSAHSGMSTIGASVSSRQSFQRALQATTINPKDADAHYQLGLLQLQRRNLSEAESRFRTAATIEPDDADYAFNLGRVLHEQGRSQEAIEHLERAARLNPNTAGNEVLRELGAVRMALGQYNESLEPLERFVDRREYDPAGLVYLGEALEHLGREAEAQQMFARAVEAAKTMPVHRRGETRPWARRAQDRLKR